MVGDVETWIESGSYVQEIGRGERILTATRGERTESATDFRCVAGGVIVHVSLKGTIVTIAK